ncbi:sulfatase [Natronorubrum halophilum]|uniref:sulfatase n=1 Tax=Natronorubrum halophilum TaxID=1702106 RepID=UPI000EF68CE5|nr:sulfatase-like hydrolase/transferase [Natronorubrum halophilum]
MTSPNVLLVILDSVRAANTSLHGHYNETTPELEAFASEATVYTQAHSPGIHSIASHVSIFTGYEVAEHRAVDHTAEIEPGTTIWEELSEIGYQTGLFTSNSVIADASSLAQSFDDVDGPSASAYPFPDALSPDELSGETGKWEFLRAALGSNQPVRSLSNGVSDQLRRIRGPLVDHDESRQHIDSFLEWTDERTRPWAACLNLMDAHYPYLPAPRYDRWGGSRLRELHEEIREPLLREFLGGRPWWQLGAFESLYDGCIRQADAIVHELLDALRARDELSNTLLVITSDHGEGFGEPCELGTPVRLIDHNFGVNEQLTHVPLIVSHPGHDQGETVDKPVSLAQFPAVVHAQLEGRHRTFKRADPVLTTTYRIQEPGDELPLEATDRSPYFGPWHAIYETRDGVVRKDALHNEYDAQMAIPNACERSVVGRADRTRIEETISSLEPATIVSGQQQVSDSIEQRLNDLGYIQ